MHVNKYLQGSLTIELSLLMPLIISVIVSVIFLGYFIHDRCVLESDAFLSTMNQSENIPDKLIGKWDITKKVDVNDDEVAVTIKGSMYFMDAFNLHLISDSIFHVDICENSIITEEVSYIRENMNRR